MRASNACLFLAMALFFVATLFGVGHRLRKPLLAAGCGAFALGLLLWGLE
jgi:hypothetical protein